MKRQIIFWIIVIAILGVFVLVTPMLDSLCPQGQTQISTFWTAVATGEQRESNICMMKENEW
jgi:hypothetical protein